MTRSHVISDDLWACLEPVLRTDSVRPGRPWNDHRLTLEAIYWHFRTGSPWRELPQEFGAWQSVWERHRRWSDDGTYERMFAVVRETSGRKDDGIAALLSVETAALGRQN